LKKKRPRTNEYCMSEHLIQRVTFAAATACRISLGGEGNALYQVLRHTEFVCSWSFFFKFLNFLTTHNIAKTDRTFTTKTNAACSRDSADTHTDAECHNTFSAR